MRLGQETTSSRKLVFTSLVAALLTLFFVFLGAPLLRVIRNQFGSRKYWLLGLFFSLLIGITGQIPILFLFSSTWIVIGLYSEFEERGFASFWLAFLVVLAATCFTLLGPMIWAKALNIDLFAAFQEGVNQFLKQIQSGNSPPFESSLFSGIKFNAELVISQIPSIVFILHLTSLSFGLIFERKTAMMFGLKFERISSHIRLLEFRVPDFFVWVTMLSFLFSFMKVGNESFNLLAMNIFNSLLGIYFFQGLAVFEVLLLVLRAGTFTRVIAYFFIVGQLFFLLSIVGLVDFWADFRKRLRKKGIKENNQNNGEHI